MKKILVIRFSSFGDIIQSLPAVQSLRQTYPSAKIDFLTKSTFLDLTKLARCIDETISFNNKKGIKELLRIAFQLRKKNYDMVFDAHSNLRTTLLYFILRTGKKLIWVERSKNRFKRFLLFYLRKNLFSWPFKGIVSYIDPLLQTGIVSTPIFQLSKLAFEKKIVQNQYIALAPSAAWEMKRWPVDHWKKLIALLLGHYRGKIILLGGKEDTFCQDLVTSDNVINLAGQLSLHESCQYVLQSDLLISADTGLIHVADIFAVPGISLIGPTAFGFATNDHIKTIEVDLPCRPCSKDGRGRCSQEVYQKCMVDISPQIVFENAKKILKI